jgi:2-polyprenyl-3-methyl-5-hydroxy-6-metoxy-1,4-benzoquinol methylase
MSNPILNFARKIKRKALGIPEPEEYKPPVHVPVEADWEKPFETLREKWREVPFGRMKRAFSEDLVKLSDGELLAAWEESLDTASVWDNRGWYRELYKEFVNGKKIIDIGCGLGFDSIHYAQHGAIVTFIDLAQSNLDVVERICKLKKVNADRFLLLENVDSLKALDYDYDAIFALGSLHHAPIEVVKPEYAELASHLKSGGRWIQFAYPKARWEKEGCKPFNTWGQYVDGERTPWAEWYDIDKVSSNLEPWKFDVVFYYEWCNNDFNWFDLKRID